MPTDRLARKLAGKQLTRPLGGRAPGVFPREVRPAPRKPGRNYKVKNFDYGTGTVELRKKNLRPVRKPGKKYLGPRPFKKRG